MIYKPILLLLSVFLFLNKAIGLHKIDTITQIETSERELHGSLRGNDSCENPRQLSFGWFAGPYASTSMNGFGLATLSK
jgi:hypothetical protein